MTVLGSLAFSLMRFTSGMVLRGRRLGRLLHVQDEWQLFPFDFHQPQRPVADFLAVGDDGDAHGVLEIFTGSGKREDVVHAGNLIPQPGPGIGFNVGIVILEDVPHSRKGFGRAVSMLLIFACA